MKEWETITLKITIQADEKGEIFDINICNLPYPYKSISYDRLPTLKELLEDFGE